MKKWNTIEDYTNYEEFDKDMDKKVKLRLNERQWYYNNHLITIDVDDKQLLVHNGINDHVFINTELLDFLKDIMKELKIK